MRHERESHFTFDGLRARAARRHDPPVGHDGSRRNADCRRRGFRPGARADFRHRQAYFPSVPKPLIAAINDPCAGLGMVLTLYCVMRFASPDAVFSMAFARRGLIAEHSTRWLLPRIVGMSKAMDLLMSARKVAAA